MTMTAMTPATGLAVRMHNETPWHFLHWINPVETALAAGLDSDDIATIGAAVGPRGLAAAIKAGEVPA